MTNSAIERLITSRAAIVTLFCTIIGTIIAILAYCHDIGESGGPIIKLVPESKISSEYIKQLKELERIKSEIRIKELEHELEKLKIRDRTQVQVENKPTEIDVSINQENLNSSIGSCGNPYVDLMFSVYANILTGDGRQKSCLLPATHCCLESGGSVPLSNPGRLSYMELCYAEVNMLGVKIPVTGLGCVM